MKSAIGKEPKIQFGKMIRKHLLAYRHYEADKYGEGEQESRNVITERIERMERHAIRRKLLYAVAAVSYTHLIVIAGLAIEKGMKAEELKSIVFPHPTVGEIIKEALY